jgi:hypothetical protein
MRYEEIYIYIYIYIYIFHLFIAFNYLITMYKQNYRKYWHSFEILVGGLTFEIIWNHNIISKHIMIIILQILGFYMAWLLSYFIPDVKSWLELWTKFTVSSWPFVKKLCCFMLFLRWSDTVYDVIVEVLLFCY